jgi:hypothetical protein
MIESIVLAAFLVLLVAVVIRVSAYSAKYIYQQAPSMLVWIALILAMWLGGVFETSKELDERIQNARNTESIEDKSRRSGSAKQRNDVEVYPKNASRGKDK